MKARSIYHREMPDINKRIFRIIDLYHDTKISAFAAYIQVPAQSIYRLYIKDKKTKKYPIPSLKVIISILKAYPDLIGNYLLTGEGYLFFSTMLTERDKKTAKIYQTFIDSKDKEIQALAIEVGKLTEKIRASKTN